MIKSSWQMLPTWIFPLTSISWMEPFNALWRHGTIEGFANERLQMELWGLQVMLMYLLGLFQLSCVLLISTSPAVGAHVSTAEGQSSPCLTPLLAWLFPTDTWVNIIINIFYKILYIYPSPHILTVPQF